MPIPTSYRLQEVFGCIYNHIYSNRCEYKALVMYIVALVSQKGGTGKITLGTTLAVAAATANKINIEKSFIEQSLFQYLDVHQVEGNQHAVYRTTFTNSELTDKTDVAIGAFVVLFIRYVIGIAPGAANR